MGRRDPEYSVNSEFIWRKSPLDREEAGVGRSVGGILHTPLVRPGTPSGKRFSYRGLLEDRGAITSAESRSGEGAEGAIPTGGYKQCCHLWPGLTALDGVQLFAQNAAAIVAVGACSSFGGVEAMQALDLPGDVELVDAGTAGADLVDVMANRRKVIVVDATPCWPSLGSRLPPPDEKPDSRASSPCPKSLLRNREFQQV